MSWLSDNVAEITAVGTWLAALVAGIYTLITHRLMSETVKASRDAAAPHLALEIRSAHTSGRFVDLVVTNYGRTQAVDIRFMADSTIPTAIPERNPDASVGSWLSGMPYLAPGESRRLFLGPLGKLEQMLKGRVIRVTIEYTDTFGKRRVSNCFVETDFRETQRVIPTDYPEDVARSLERIASTLGSRAN